MPLQKARYWSILLLLAVGIVCALLIARSHFRGRDQPVVLNGIVAPAVPPLDADRVAEGEPNWKTRLADGSLPSPPHDSSGHTWHHPDELLIDIVSHGGNPGNNSKMPGFKDQLAQDQIVAILNFIKSHWGREEREFQWWMTAVGGQQ